jgi:hypothetical protein
MIEGSLSVQGAFRARWRHELAAAGADTPAALKGPSAEFRSLIQPTLERFDKEWSEHSLEERTWGLETKLSRWTRCRSRYRSGSRISIARPRSSSLG